MVGHPIHPWAIPTCGQIPSLPLVPYPTPGSNPPPPVTSPAPPAVRDPGELVPGRVPGEARRFPHPHQRRPHRGRVPGPRGGREVGRGGARRTTGQRRTHRPHLTLSTSLLSGSPRPRITAVGLVSLASLVERGATALLGAARKHTVENDGWLLSPLCQRWILTLTLSLPSDHNSFGSSNFDRTHHKRTV